MYEDGIAQCRKNHIPVLFHITELTQPLGHSTSGSHERYKTKDQLEWEKEFDCLLQMRKWILENAMAESSELEEIEVAALQKAREAREKPGNISRIR
jgi:TPP-dependent pyruvate/acetoin dehydrogenase alpha subunit